MSWPGIETDVADLGPGYQFVRPLGHGGSGWVVLVRHVTLDRFEAVKTVRAGSRLLPVVQRLEREGRVLAQLRHPNVVTIYRMVPSAATLALIMEYVPGGDLQQALDSGRLTGADRIAVLGDVAAGLSVAAAAGVVHRDVKPANVLLRPSGRAVLTDFGLARLSEPDALFRTMSGAATGTPMFMAPEQIDRPDEQSAAIDAYAFGVMAYRMLTGHWPYQVDSIAEVIDAHRHRIATPPWEVLPDFPRRIGKELLAALAKDPAARLAPNELVRALRDVPDAQWDTLVFEQAGPHAGHPVDAPRRVDGPSPGAVAGPSGTGPPSLAASTAEQTGQADSPGTVAQGDGTGGSNQEPDPVPEPNPADVRVRPPVYVVPRRRRQIIALSLWIVAGVLLGVLLTILLARG